MGDGGIVSGQKITVGFLDMASSQHAAGSREERICQGRIEKTNPKWNIVSLSHATGTGTHLTQSLTRRAHVESHGMFDMYTVSSPCMYIKH